MAEAKIIEDLDGLPGEKVYDYDGNDLGKIDRVYTLGEDNAPMWVTVGTSGGLTSTQTAFIPLARLKLEDGRLQVPYSKGHIQDAPQVEASDELSEDDDRALRDYYAIDLADQELRTDNISYAAQVPDGDGPASVADSSS